ncbi:hypothetical protein EVAR_24592_1 [Eumeta japonica]|uniref:Uncharacterized protein n=1 Tax=Eumeta variegata TaxID=151549 RepID=A0A4C1W7R9_EUMVA|nr:hypothetical protein EVAR_24592_1 [Eumeta japonica]
MPPSTKRPAAGGRRKRDKTSSVKGINGQPAARGVFCRNIFRPSGHGIAPVRRANAVFGPVRISIRTLPPKTKKRRFLVGHIILVSEMSRHTRASDAPRRETRISGSPTYDYAIRLKKIPPAYE